MTHRPILKSSVALRCTVLVTALMLSVGFAPTALAWQQPVNSWSSNYYMPGPPPGSYTSACIVRGRYDTNADPNYFLSAIQIYDNSSSDCIHGKTRVVYTSGDPHSTVLGATWRPS